MSGLIIAILVAVLVVLVLAAVVVVAKKKRDSKQLQERFGSEYDREIDRTGDKKEAEGRLRQREERRAELEIRPLEAGARERYAQEWRALQARFVDQPEQAVRDSDRLVAEVMRERGYPVDDFDRRAQDISVDHPEVAENYRSAHAIAERTERGDSSTEELRQATVHYRSLFEELLETHVGGRRGAEDGDHGHGRADGPVGGPGNADAGEIEQAAGVEGGRRNAAGSRGEGRHDAAAPQGGTRDGRPADNREETR
jgi:predicted nucleic acid-binding protein